MSGFADYQPDVDRQSADATITVRPAELADLEACAGLIVSRTGGSVEARTHRLMADLREPERYAAVACAGDEVIGYGGVIHHEVSPGDPPDMAPTGYYLVGLIVAPDWRRHGIGELLTADRMRWTAERADSIYYFANLANGATLDLHHSLGFTEVTRDFTFPGDPLQPGTGVLLRADLTTGQ
ncbi:ribosomal protein S18 acetylase RimI-like enzyme [Kribbella steppae]|uniref:Ribosomal protein S18 acetylase RimI-like enzyme n=1 Tax=Kribbella steppae TaxID=2512223 RepID=A0A4R2HGE4_9ACTN|nr:GNAT family N-acetyltransferase [Kribbella steppae]TCO28182.1 ribosomal protein S18 acetylase RimI-like enzyme [Kribbella steppae]